MRFTITATLVVTLAAGATAAAAAAKDPASLILRPADLPAKATFTWGDIPGSALGGTQAKGAYYQATIPKSSTKYEQVSGMVVAAASSAQASKIFTLFARQAKRDGTGSTTVSVPSYGNSQLALLQSPKKGAKVDLLVRKNTVVWQLEVAGGGLLVLSKGTSSAS